MLLLAIIASAHSPSILQCRKLPGRIEVVLPADMDPAIRYMAVVKGDRWLPVVDETHKLAPFKSGTKSFTVRTATQRAVDYRNGKAVSVKAFTTTGIYKLVFSDNLETEPEEMASVSCSVRIRSR